MSTIVTRAGKGAPLTHNEVDANFTNLNADKYQAGDNPSFGNITVTGTVDGRDVSADGTKLDGIEAGATADQTAAEILTAIKTVDGASSGLDADLLDGNHASAFSLASHNHTLDSLSNTTITSNTSGEILKWNGTAWVNNTLAEAGIQPAGSYLTTSTTFGGDVSGTYNAIVVADDSHNHIIANVDGLQTALDGKSATTHNHTLDSLSNTTITSNTAGEILKWNGTAWINNTLAEAGIQPAGSYLTGNQTITLSGDLTGSGTTSINAQLAANVVGANELNVVGNGTTAQYLRSDGDGSFTWATPTDTNTTYTAGDGLTLAGTVFSHTDTSTQVSVNNSGSVYIQGITLDTYGHVTGITSTTVPSSVPTTYGDVGTYMFGYVNYTSTTSMSQGSTIAGSAIDPAGMRVSSNTGRYFLYTRTTTSPSGTWRIMGYFSGINADWNWGASIFVRIA